jgi:pimeloyl-ACP methyl ester carboxylesterase
VLEDLGEERCIVVSNWTSSPVGIAFAALHPHRTQALVLLDPWPRVLFADDFPLGFDADSLAWAVDVMRSSWGEGGSVISVPSLGNSEADRALVARMERLGCGRGVMTAYWEHMDFDVRPMLPLIQAPTLIVAHDGSVLYDVGIAHTTAALMDPAPPVLVFSCADLELYGPQPPELLDAVETFLRERWGYGERRRESQVRGGAVQRHRGLDGPVAAHG